MRRLTLLILLVGQVCPAVPPSSHGDWPGPLQPMHWIATDPAPASVRAFVDSVPSRKDDYIRSTASKVTELKSQIDELKQQRGAASKTKVVFRDVGGGASEADGNAYAKEEHQSMIISSEIEQKWKEVHQQEANIKAAQSDPLWLPPTVDWSSSDELEYGPLPSNYKDYLIKVPAGSDQPLTFTTTGPTVSDASSSPTGGPDCLKLEEPQWQSDGSAKPQLLRDKLTGTSLQLKPFDVALVVDAVDQTHIVLKAERRNAGLGDLSIAPVGKLDLDGGKLSFQWTSHGGVATVIAALNTAVLLTTDGRGTTIERYRFVPRIDATLNCAGGDVIKIALPRAAAKSLSWQVDGLPSGWTIAPVPTTAPSSLSAASSTVFPSSITLAADKASLTIAYDPNSSTIQSIQKDDLQQQCDSLQAKLVPVQNATGLRYRPTDQQAVTRAQLASLREPLAADHEHWQALSACTISAILPNSLDVARLRLNTNKSGDGGDPTNDPITPEAAAQIPPSAAEPAQGSAASPKLLFDFNQKPSNPGEITYLADKAVTATAYNTMWSKTSIAAGFVFNGGQDQGRSDTSGDTQHSYIDVGQAVAGFPLDDFSIDATFVATNGGSIIGSGQNELWPREWGLGADAFWWTSVPGHASGAVGKVSNVIAFKARFGEPTHLCVTRRGNTVTVYVNGTRAAQQHDFPADAPLPIYSNGLMIGNSKRNRGRYTQWNTFGGTISSVTIYSKALGDDEVRHLHSAVGDASNRPAIPAKAPLFPEH